MGDMTTGGSLCDVRCCARAAEREVAGLRVCSPHAKLWWRRQSFGYSAQPSEASIMRDLEALTIAEAAADGDMSRVLLGVLLDQLSARQLQRLIQRKWISVYLDASHRAVACIADSGLRTRDEERARVRRQRSQIEACRTILKRSGKIDAADTARLDDALASLPPDETFAPPV